MLPNIHIHFLQFSPYKMFGDKNNSLIFTQRLILNRMKEYAVHKTAQKPERRGKDRLREKDREYIPTVYTIQMFI